MKSSSISDNLQQLLARHHELSLSELARQTNIPQPTLHHLVNGLTKKPRRKVLEALANYFKISIAELIGQAPLPESTTEELHRKFKMSIIPIISWDSLKKWPSNRKNINQLGELIFTQAIGKHSFALLMKEAVVELLFPESSILIFNSEIKPQEKEIVIVYSGTEDKIRVNRLFIENSDYYLKQQQPNGDITFIKLNLEKDKILGALIEARLSEFNSMR